MVIPILVVDDLPGRLLGLLGLPSSGFSVVQFWAWFKIGQTIFTIYLVLGDSANRPYRRES